MKYFKLIIVCVLSFGIAACEDEEITNYAFAEISAPTDVSANFDVTQDDSGVVTITPVGEGASTFDIYFGDVENEQPTNIPVGESATNTYSEGTYQVRIVAVGPTGLTSEYNQQLVIAFRTPENLEVTIDQPANDPANISVSATAEFATLFEVYFGDTENEEPTQLMPGNSLDHSYESPGEYQLRVVAIGAGAATTEFTTTIIVPDANDPIVLPITFDSPTVNYAMGTFNGSSFGVIDNPELSGINDQETKVGALTNTGNNFEGGVFNLGTPVDFSGSNKTISMKMWSNVAVPVLLKFEAGVNDERQTEVVADHSGNGWEELTFDFSKDAVKSFIDGNQGVGEPFVPTGQYGAMVIFVDGPGTTAGTFYLDDIKQISSGVNNSAVVQDFEGAAPTFNVFGNIADTEVVANPDMSGVNTTANVAKLTKSAGSEVWAGTFFELASPLDLNSFSMIKVATWSPKVGAVVKLKLENEDASIVHEVDLNTTVANSWEILSYDFSGAPTADYVRVVIFFDFGNAGDDSVYYFDEIELTNGSSGPAISVFQDFEGEAPTFTVFGNIADTEVIANPDASGENTTSMVAQLTKTAGSEVWAGSFYEVAAALDLNTYSNISVKTWSPKVGAVVKLKLENQDASIVHEVDLNTTVANSWETLTYDFSGAPAADYVRVVIFFDFGNAGDDSVYYFDEFTLSE